MSSAYLVVIGLQHPQVPMPDRALFEYAEHGSQSRDAFVPRVVEMQISVR